MRRPVGSMPWNGPPVNVPVARHWTAATSWSAVIRVTVNSKSGNGRNSSLKRLRTASGPRNTPSGMMSSTPSGCQQAAIASGSRAVTASK